ncbi:hypothetical protein [Chryseobacterium muglaense]|nr:hypothetical protein [Chryseobacterium muglaense]
MKTNLITLSLILIGLSSIACRQDENGLMDDEQVNTAQASDKSSETQRVNSEDSLAVNLDTGGDPPKNGTHWKISDSIKVNTPKNISDLSSITIPPATILEEEPTDPPKNGTHWKTK